MGARVLVALLGPTCVRSLSDRSWPRGRALPSFLYTTDCCGRGRISSPRSATGEWLIYESGDGVDSCHSVTHRDDSARTVVPYGRSRIASAATVAGDDGRLKVPEHAFHT